VKSRWSESATASAGGRLAPTSQEKTATRRSTKKAEEDELKQLRAENAALLGFMSRLHGHLHLQGIELNERFEACEKWLSGQVNKKEKA